MKHDDLHDPDQRPDGVDVIIGALFVIIAVLLCCALGGSNAAS